jgi:hypothetical protein
MPFKQLLIVLIVTLSALSPVVMGSDVPDPLFQDDATLDITLTAPLATLVRKRPTLNPLAGEFSFRQANGRRVFLDVELLSRGQPRHKDCDLPPLSLKFRKSQTDGTLFDQENEMKMVVHCDDSDDYQQLVHREFLAYKFLNALTDQSFRVRLLRVTYIDNEEERGDQVRYAFLIEDESRLASRLGKKIINTVQTVVDAIQPDQLNLTSMFQLLIGNTDFSVVDGGPDIGCCHNYVLLGTDGGPQIAIPYNFDQSGLVNAPYAVSDEKLSIQNVRHRYYRGWCKNNDYIEASINRTRDTSRAIFSLIYEQEGLQGIANKGLVRFVENYYDIVDNSSMVKLKIIGRCQGY